MKKISQVIDLIVSFFKLAPVPHDKFDEWPVSAGQFIRECHIKSVDRSKLTECDPTCPPVPKGGWWYF